MILLNINRHIFKPNHIPISEQSCISDILFNFPFVRDLKNATSKEDTVNQGRKRPCS